MALEVPGLMYCRDDLVTRTKGRVQPNVPISVDLATLPLPDSLHLRVIFRHEIDVTSSVLSKNLRRLFLVCVLQPIDELPAGKVILLACTQPKRITEVDRISRRVPIQIQPARDPDRVFLRVLTGPMRCYVQRRRKGVPRLSLAARFPWSFAVVGQKRPDASFRLLAPFYARPRATGSLFSAVAAGRGKRGAPFRGRTGAARAGPLAGAPGLRNGLRKGPERSAGPKQRRSEGEGA